MEFTEVFGNETDKTKGFDIIIGNPPFIRIENIEEPARTLYKENYGLAEKRFDIYILFYELSNNILKEDGYFGFVSSNKFLKSQTATKMRKFIKNKIVDSHKNHHFIGMKTLAAGKLDPKQAYEYVSKYNICCTTIGMVSVDEAIESTKIALKSLKNV